MERPRVIIISRIKEIYKLDLSLEEVEIYYSSNILDFRRFTSPSKLAFIKNIDTTYNDSL